MNFLSLLSVLSLLSFTSFGVELPPKLGEVACRTKIESVLVEYKSKDKWRRVIDPGPNAYAFRSPTSVFAQWVEVHSTDNPRLFLYKGGGVRLFQWNRTTCEREKMSDSVPVSFFKPSKPSFDDNDLKKILDQGGKAMIYVWSPAMIYSVTELNTFKAVAHEMKLRFIPVLDPNVDDGFAKTSLRGFDSELPLKRLGSIELVMREATVHYPATYIINKGKISNRIVGVMNHEQLAGHVSKELSALEGQGD